MNDCSHTRTRARALYTVYRVLLVQFKGTANVPMSVVFWLGGRVRDRKFTDDAELEPGDHEHTQCLSLEAQRIWQMQRATVQ